MMQEAVESGKAYPAAREFEGKVKVRLSDFTLGRILAVQDLQPNGDCTTCYAINYKGKEIPPVEIK